MKPFKSSVFVYPHLLAESIILVGGHILLVTGATIYLSEYINYISGSSINSHFALAGIIVYIFLEAIILLANYLYQVGFAHIRKNVSTYVRCSMIDLISTKLSPSEYERIGKNALIGILVNDIKQLRSEHIGTQISCIRVVFRLVAFTAIIFYYNFGLGFTSVILFGLTLIWSVHSSAILETFGLKEVREREKYIVSYQDSLNARNDFRYVCRDEFLRHRIRSANLSIEGRIRELKNKQLSVNTVHSLIRVIAKGILFGIELYLVSLKRLSVGALVATIPLFSLLEDEISAAQEVISRLSKSKRARARINDLYKELNLAVDTNEESDPRNWTVCGLRDVSIQFGGTYALNHFDIQIQKGKKYLIVGENGSGKSTMLKALLGAQAGTGEILLDDASFPLGSTVIANLADYMSQSFYLFNSTIENNIAFGDSKRMKTLQATEFYKKLFLEYLPDVTKVIKNNGGNLSGGEKQLIGVARVLAGGKELLVFDESFSAMDQGVFEQILAFLLKMQEKTVIIVSHRIHNHQGFDAVCELKKERAL